jgi:hypothetical protein
LSAWSNYRYGEAVSGGYEDFVAVDRDVRGVQRCAPIAALDGNALSPKLVAPSITSQAVDQRAVRSQSEHFDLPTPYQYLIGSGF